MVTTEGSIFAAAAAMVPSSLGAVEAAPVTLIGAPVGSRPDVTNAYEPIPAPAPISADIDAATSRVARRCRGGLTAVAVPGAVARSGQRRHAHQRREVLRGPYPGNRWIGTVGSPPSR